MKRMKRRKKTIGCTREMFKREKERRKGGKQLKTNSKCETTKTEKVQV